jgi:hypothetical protein
MRTTLLIPDAHVEPNQDLSRFELASKLILDRRPDAIIDMGDFCSFGSLSHWDQNRRLLMENKRFSRDLEAGNEAYNLLTSGIRTQNEQARKNKSRKYSPEFVKLMGNHEEWPLRYAEQHPALEGVLCPIKNLYMEERGFKVIPYREVINIHGINYCHAVMAQNNQPVSGKYDIVRAWERFTSPVIFGHNHRFKVFGDRRIDGTHTTESVSVGCFFEEVPAYAKGAKSGWWSGLVLINQWDDSGAFDMERISIERLKYEYGVSA